MDKNINRKTSNLYELNILGKIDIKNFEKI